MISHASIHCKNNKQQKMEYFAFIYRKKWNIFKRKPIKKHLLSSNQPLHLNYAVRQAKVM